MKKVIEGAVYNTKTAKKICERYTEEFEQEKGAVVKKLQQLFKTKSNKYFLFEKSEFTSYADSNSDDLNPKYEELELEEKRIIPVSYELAYQFASEIACANPDSIDEIGNFFPELVDNEIDENNKIQKKLYISEKANWYLEMMITDSSDTNSSFIEKLIVEEYRRLYSKGIMTRDPFFEMEDKE